MATIVVEEARTIGKTRPKVGDRVAVAVDAITRQGHSGIVTSVDEDGATIDFDCGWDGGPKPSPAPVEFWGYEELVW